MLIVDYEARKTGQEGQKYSEEEERLRKNPASGRHQPSRLMRIVGVIQFLRGCVII